MIGGALINHGGPVQPAPLVYVDFWGWTSDPSGEQPYLTNFLSSIGGTPWLGTVKQYGGNSPANPHLLAGTWSDPAAVPANPSDAQIQAEAANAAAHFGTGNSVNVQIVVATPTGHSTPGFGTQWCAYHGAVSAAPNITYTDLPYMTDAGTNCGQGSVNGSNGRLDGVSIVEGHELAEAVTDPLLNAWYDASGYEIGDKCAWYNLANIATSTGTFAVQPLWSNAANGRVLGTGSGAITASGSSTDDAGNLQVIVAVGAKIYHEIRYASRERHLVQRKRPRPRRCVLLQPENCRGRGPRLHTKRAFNSVAPAHAQDVISELPPWLPRQWLRPYIPA